jgi:hypothetical protein
MALEAEMIRRPALKHLHDQPAGAKYLPGNCETSTLICCMLQRRPAAVFAYPLRLGPLAGQPVSNAYNITVALEPRSWA